jgi:hypothetical protein
MKTNPRIATKSDYFHRLIGSSLIGWILFVTLARAIRFPNDFAKGFWLVDYRFGFIKRGFVGSLATLLEQAGVITLSETTIRVFSFVFLGAFIIGIFAVTLRVLAKSDWTLDSFLTMAVFASSPFFVMSAHLIGYFDNIVMAFSLLAVWLVLRDRPWLGACLIAVAVLIHESSLIFGYPLFCMAVFFRTPRKPRDRDKGLMSLGLPLVVFAVLIASAHWVNLPVVRTLLTIRLEESGFVGNSMDKMIPQWLTANFMEYFRAQSPLFRERILSRETAITLPSVVALLAFLYGAGGIGSRFRRMAVFCVIVFLPFAVHAVAWDTARIATYSIFTAFGCLWFNTESAEVTRLPSPWLRLWMLGILIFNYFPQLPLMDNEVENFSAPVCLALYLPVLIGITVLWRLELQRAGSEDGPRELADFL